MIPWLPIMALAAAGGGALRWWLAARANRRLPIGTFGANIAACLAVGLLDGLSGAAGFVVRIGLLGALSTWSTLAAEARTLWHNERHGAAVGYVGLSVVTGVGAAALGLHLGS